MYGLLAQQQMNSHSEMSMTEIISPFMGVFFAAFFLSFVATPVMRELAIRNGIIDAPDLKRKNHLRPVAYLGGIAIFLGWFAGAAFTFVLWPSTDNVIMSIMLGATAITITGVLDDVYHISPRVKIGGQLFAAAALASQNVGVRLAESAVNVMGLHDMVPFTVIYILGTLIIAAFVIGGCNATNLLDGLDGLAAGVCAIACLGFLVIAALIAQKGILDPADDGTIHTVRMCIILATLGAAIGFLPFNFNPASIFMGDAGSLLLGYLCLTCVLLFTPDTAHYAPKLVTALLIVFALPIADTLLAIIRRKIQGKPITAPDYEHLHHLLRRSGLGVKRSVLILYTAAIFFAVLGVALVALDLRWRYMLAVFFPLYAFIMVIAYQYGQQLNLRDKLDRQKAEAESKGNVQDAADAKADTSTAAPPPPTTPAV